MKLLAATAAPPLVTVAPPRPRRLAPVLIALGLLGAAVVAAAGLGKAPIPLDVQAQIIGQRVFGLPGAVAWPASYETILLEIRLPRIVLAALVGGALAVAGAGYQGLFRNPLADPYLMGVAGGAGAGAVLALVLPLPAVLYSLGVVQGLAFAGALAAVVVVTLLARVGRTTPVTTLLLAGVALGALANALTAALLTLHGDKLPTIYAWLLGGFGVATWRQVALVGPLVLLSALTIALCGRLLNTMQAGEEAAAGLGVEVERLKLLLVGAATLATAAAVSVGGLIGFVGLIVPHAVRLLAGPDHRRLVPTAALAGAAFLVAADTLARIVPGPAELPVGVITAGVGVPFFLVLLRRQKRAVFG